MIKIDRKDRKILRCLDMNARLPLKRLAKEVGIGREVAEYRIKRLRKIGVISGAHTVFDVHVLGYQSFRLLLRLFHLPPKDKKNLMDYLVQHKNTWWVASVGGRWDVIINFIAEDAAAFNDIFEEIVTRYGEYLQQYELLTYIDIHDYPRKYIISDEKYGADETLFYHTMRPKQEIILDKVDFKIMSFISNNANANYTEIGEKIGLTRNAVKQRIFSLEKKKIILGYRLSYHPTTLGYNSYLLLLNINNLKKDREKMLLTYAEKSANIIFTVKHIGKYRITFECEVENERKFHDLLVDIRDKFNDIIIEFDFFPIFMDHKINYFPLE